MLNFRVPPIPQFSIPRGLVIAPDGSLVYANFMNMCWFRVPHEFPVIFDNRCKIWSIDCDPHWDTSKHVAVLGEDKHLWIWDLEKGVVVKGHYAHTHRVTEKLARGDDPLLAMCYTRGRKVISTDTQCIVVYDVASNTYKVHTQGEFGTRRNIFSILSASPYDADVFAAGTQAGLIFICSVKDMTIISTIRGHDSKIWSFDWIKYEENVVEDLFDVSEHTQSHDDEFGVTVERFKNFNPSDEHTDSKANFDEKFDFQEALADTMLMLKGRTSTQDTQSNGLPTVEQCRERKGYDSNDSESEGERSLKQDDDTPSISTEQNKSVELIRGNGERILLLSASVEQTLLIWDLSYKETVCHNIGNNMKRTGLYRNFVAKFISDSSVVSFSVDGDLQINDLIQETETRFKFIRGDPSKYSKVRAIVDVCVNRENGDIWVTSMYQQLCCLHEKSKLPKYDYSTLHMRVQAMDVSPIDPNLVAIGSLKRISLLNVSTVSQTHFTMPHLTAKIQTHIISLAYHPEKENVLAFSTREGRVGIMDTSRVTSTPVCMAPYGIKEKYNLQWVKRNGNFEVFCCANYQLLRYALSGPSKHNAQVIDVKVNVSCIAVKENLIAVGTKIGEVLICDVNDEFKPIYSSHRFTRLISSMSWNENHLAVAAYDSVARIIDLSDKENDTVIELTGHSGQIYYISWHKYVENRVVTSSADSTVRIWDTCTGACLHTLTFEHEVLIAIFHPSVSSQVIVGGKDFPLTICDYTEAVVFTANSTNAKSPRKAETFEAAKAGEVDVLQKIAKEKRKNRKKQTIETLTKSMSSVDINSAEVESVAEPPQAPARRQYNYTTIFHITTKELNQNPLQILDKMLNSRKTGEKEIRHDLLLSEDQSDVQTVFAEELKAHKKFGTQSVGHSTFPMLSFKLKESILESIESKTLTEEQIALAPFISYVFWKNCCEAFAIQCVDQGEILRSVNYFLMVNQVSEAINALCRGKYFTEAVAVARSRSSSLLEKVIDDWVGYLKHCGNFEGAAIIFTATKKYKEATEVLELRKEPTEELLSIIKGLKEIGDGISSTTEDIEN